MSQSPMENIVGMDDDKQHQNLTKLAATTNLNEHISFNCGATTPTLPTNIFINAQSSPLATPRSKCDENPCNKIFVGGLSWDTTQEKLYEYFSEFGPITDCILMLDGATGRSRGFGFVTFLQQESVKSVLSVKQHILDNKIIDPKEAVPKHIKDIENRVNSSQPNCHTPTLINSYSCSNGCGGVVSGTGNNAIPVTAATTNTTNSHNNSGAKSSAKQSLSRRSSCVGEQLILPNTSFGCQHNSIPSSSCFLCPNVLHNTKIFVGGIGHVSEADLREYFSTFGTVVDVNIMMDKSTGRPRGFAFIGFSTSEAADLTASMRYHFVRNKQVEVKKALPKDTKYLSTPNHNTAVFSNVSSAVAAATTTSVISENHSIISHSHFHSTNLHNNKNSFNITSYPSDKNILKNYNSINNDYQQQYPLHSTNNPKLNSTFDESIVSHEQPISNVVTPVGTANCSLVSGCSTVGNDDRTASILQSATVYGGEWDFDDVIHFDDTKSGAFLTTNSFGGVNSPLHTNPINSDIHANNTAQPNNLIHSVKNLGGAVNGSSTLLHRHDNTPFGISSNRGSCGRRPQGCALGFDTNYDLNLGIASACNPSTTVTDRLQPTRFNSVGDTTTLLNRQIPDDTKNSIVELLNEIWKGAG